MCHFLRCGWIVVVAGENDLRIFRRQDCIERLLVEGAGLAVDGDEKRLVAQRLDVLAVVLGDVLRDLLHALLALEEVLQVHRAIENLVQLLDVGDALGFGEREELLLHDVVRHEHLVRREVVVERQRRAVLDALRDRVLVQVALIVLAAEGLERAFAVRGLVHRRAGEADEGRVRQAGHQVVAEVAAGRAVGLVDQHEDVLARVEVRRHVAELVDHRDDDAAIVLALLVEQLVERRDAVGVRHVAPCRPPRDS